MYGWPVSHDPGYAQATWGVIVLDARDELGIPVPVTGRSLDTALGLNGGMGNNTLNDFLRHVMTPVADAR